MAPLQSPSMGWPGVQGTPTTPIVKRVVRLDVPVDKYPNVSEGVYIETILTKIIVLFNFIKQAEQVCWLTLYLS